MTDGMVNTKGIIGALYDPLDGHLDPSGTTHAYAKAARMGGAEIVLHNRVLETNPRADGSAGKSSPKRARSSANIWSMRAGFGRAKSARWRGFTCRCCRWRTSIW